MSVNVDTFLPAGRDSFPVWELAKILSCSDHHIYKLIRAGAIAVPEENVRKAKTHATIVLPRAAVAEFIRVRSSDAWRKQQNAKKRAKARRCTTKTAARRKRACNGVATQESPRSSKRSQTK
jgi:hypothetical protein